MDKQYLGDGVYASFDGYQIKLETLEGNEIYINDDVFASLMDYGRKAFLGDDSAQPEPEQAQP